MNCRYIIKNTPRQGFLEDRTDYYHRINLWLRQELDDIEHEGYLIIQCKPITNEYGKIKAFFIELEKTK